MLKEWGLCSLIQNHTALLQLREANLLTCLQPLQSFLYLHQHQTERTRFNQRRRRQNPLWFIQTLCSSQISSENCKTSRVGFCPQTLTNQTGGAFWIPVMCHLLYLNTQCLSLLLDNLNQKKDKGLSHLEAKTWISCRVTLWDYVGICSH